MATPDELKSMPRANCSSYDYRYSRAYFDKSQRKKIPLDRSVFTFEGHEVVETLIRCQFSPLETTG